MIEYIRDITRSRNEQHKKKIKQLLNFYQDKRFEQDFNLTAEVLFTVLPNAVNRTPAAIACYKNSHYILTISYELWFPKETRINNCYNSENCIFVQVY